MVSVDCVCCSSSKWCAHDAWYKCHMAVFFMFFCKFFIAYFVVVLNVLIAGDLRHEYAQSAWGFLFRGPPGYWLHSLRLHRGNWCSFDNDCCCRMNIVVILMMSSWRLYCVCRWGRLVAPRLIATALLVALEERSSCEHFGASQWWHQLGSLQSVMALIIPIVIGKLHCCLLLLVATVPSSNACIVFKARILIV
jgi:hypothetical protein